MTSEVSAADHDGWRRECPVSPFWHVAEGSGISPSRPRGSAQKLNADTTEITILIVIIYTYSDTPLKGGQEFQW